MGNQGGLYCLAQATLRPVVFDDDDPSASCMHCFVERPAVDRLNGVGIDQPHRDALRLELVAGFDSLVDRDPGSNNRDPVMIRLPDHLAAADHELFIACVEYGRLLT